eukprot:309985_1
MNTQITGKETIRELRQIIASNEIFRGIRKAGKGVTKQRIIEQINNRLAAFRANSSNETHYSSHQFSVWFTKFSIKITLLKQEQINVPLLPFKRIFTAFLRGILALLSVVLVFTAVIKISYNSQILDNPHNGNFNNDTESALVTHDPLLIKKIEKLQGKYWSHTKGFDTPDFMHGVGFDRKNIHKVREILLKGMKRNFEYEVFEETMLSEISDFLEFDQLKLYRNDRNEHGKYFYDLDGKEKTRFCIIVIKFTNYYRLDITIISEFRYELITNYAFPLWRVMGYKPQTHATINGESKPLYEWFSILEEHRFRDRLRGEYPNLYKAVFKNVNAASLITKQSN